MGNVHMRLTSSNASDRLICWGHQHLQLCLLAVRFTIPVRINTDQRKRHLLPLSRGRLWPQRLHPPLSPYGAHDSRHRDPSHRHHRRGQHRRVRPAKSDAVRQERVVLWPLSVVARGAGGRTVDHELVGEIYGWLGHRQWGGRVWRQGAGRSEAEARQEGQEGRQDEKVGHDDCERD